MPVFLFLQKAMISQYIGKLKVKNTYRQQS